MFANTFQSGILSIFYSVGSNPLNSWDTTVKNGHIRRIIDDEIKSQVLEISGTNVATTYITCPIKPRASLGIRLPYMVMVVRNLKKYFTFEIQILDDKNMRRRFRISNFQSTTKVRPFCTTMPIGLSGGWNQVQFNLADFARRAYGTVYIETVRVQIHANVRIRRIYFSNRLYTEDELPTEYKLVFPAALQKKSQASVPPVKIQGKVAEAKNAKNVKNAAAGEEIPLAAPPTPADVAEVEIAQVIMETVVEEPATSSIEPAPGDVADVEELTEEPTKAEELTAEPATEAAPEAPPTESDAIPGAAPPTEELPSEAGAEDSPPEEVEAGTPPDETY